MQHKGSLWWLPTYPHIKFNILVSNRLDIEAHCGDGVDALAQLELVEDRGFARRVQPQHQDPHLLVPEHLGEYFPHDEARDQDAVRKEALWHWLKLGLISNGTCFSLIFSLLFHLLIVSILIFANTKWKSRTKEVFYSCAFYMKRRTDFLTKVHCRADRFFLKDTTCEINNRSQTLCLGAQDLRCIAAWFPFSIHILNGITSFNLIFIHCPNTTQCPILRSDTSPLTIL